MSTALVAAPPAQIALAPENQEAILRALNLDPRDPKTQALVLTCQRYGLDPLLKHAVLIQGTLYVTRDGLMHVAHMSGVLDGIEVEFLEETNTHFIARATVWRKDMGRPFSYQGRFPKNGKNPVGNQYGPEMAEKVAECRALRRAFSIALCSREETWEEMDPAAPTQRPSMGNATVAEYPRQTAAAPGPRKAAPAPPPDWDPRGDFITLAQQKGFDILNGEGKPSKEKLIAVLNTIHGTTTFEELPKNKDLWGSALQALEVHETPSMGNTPDAEDIDASDLSDPFAE